MTKNIFAAIILLLCFNVSLSQSADGYWDKERTTTKEIELCAGCRTFVRTDDLPVGTTEIIYRITILDENQKLASSLASVLNAIPDPSGISQGSAGAVTLLSKISGDDECTFGIFTSQKDAVSYKNTGDEKSACMIHPKEISKMAGRLTLQNSTCLEPETRFLWFGFKSSNKLMKQKIIVEVVPWVNKKASRGWTSPAKQKFVDNCKVKVGNKPLANKQEFCDCMLDKLQQHYTVQDLQQLSEMEYDRTFDKFAKTCLIETGETTNSFNQLRKDASVLMTEGKYGEAIIKLTDIIDNGQPTSADYSNIGYSYIMTKQYLRAIKYLKSGEQKDSSDLQIKANLGHAYLFSGDVKSAKIIYSMYKAQNVNEHMSWRALINEDFTAFKKASLPTDNFKSVLRLLK